MTNALVGSDYRWRMTAATGEAQGGLVIHAWSDSSADDVVVALGIWCRSLQSLKPGSDRRV